MGSTLNPGIILGGQQPQQPNTLQTLGQIQSLKNAQTENLLRTQQANDISQQAQARQKDIEDQNVIQRAMADPAINAKVHTGDFSDLEGKVQPKTLDSIRQSQVQYQGLLQSQSEAQNKIRADALGEVNKAISGLRTLPDINSINTALPGVIHYLNASGVLKRAEIDPSKLPQSVSDPKQLDMAQASIGGALAAHEQVLADQKTQADTRKSSADAQVAQQKADMQEQFMEEAKANPQAVGQQVDKIINPSVDSPTNQAYKTAIQGAMSRGDLDSVGKLYEAAASHSASLNQKINPSVLNAEVQTAARKAFAEVPAHVQAAVQTQLAVAKNSPDLFANIADPILRRQAEEGYMKTSLEAQQQVSDARRLQEYVQAAQNKNKAAAGMIPIIELRQIVNRVNAQELKQAGMPGNILDTGMATLNGIVNGVPASSEGLKAIADLSKVQESNTVRNYQAKIGVMSQVYANPKMKPLDLQSNYDSAKGSSASGSVSGKKVFNPETGKIEVH